MPSKLCPGKGARATTLTRYIKPKQHLPSGNKQHCSDVVVVSMMKRVCLLSLFVEEGPEEDLFDEKSISWEDSHARSYFTTIWRMELSL
jgi:hypothetical protein